MTVYKMYVRMKNGCLVVVTGYDYAEMFLEEFGNDIAYIIKEVVVTIA